METRGAGIVVQPEMTAILERYGAPPLPMTSCSGRHYLDPAGGNGQAQAMPQYFTSWEAIYRSLRSAFPAANYHTGSSVKAFENIGATVALDVPGHTSTPVDLLVCADGAQSETRRRLLPNVKPHYAGYIAWRGTLPEANAAAGLVEFFDNTFTFSEARNGGHILVYFIPGPNADPTPGKRLINWVWYVHAREEELTALLTDRQGRRHNMSLPQGGATDAAIADLRILAKAEVHPRMAELVAATPDPFIQTILDVVVPRTVFGRACLLGDAAFVVRPHTAGATAKAARDAMVLADALAQVGANDVPRALEAFESTQLQYGQQLYQYGVALGDRWTRPLTRQ
jgi:2-polyprenyl-6-methoxyphenol hydroxylase-like FAD-dependent oxidoreductase